MTLETSNARQAFGADVAQAVAGTAPQAPISPHIIRHGNVREAIGLALVQQRHADGRETGPAGMPVFSLREWDGSHAPAEGSLRCDVHAYLSHTFGAERLDLLQDIAHLRRCTPLAG